MSWGAYIDSIDWNYADLDYNLTFMATWPLFASIMQVCKLLE